MTAQEFREARRKLGLTQSGLARIMGMTQPQMARIEKVGPTHVQAAFIRHLLECRGAAKPKEDTMTMTATLRNLITGATIEVRSTTDHPTSSNGLAVWVDAAGNSYGQCRRLGTYSADLGFAVLEVRMSGPRITI